MAKNNEIVTKEEDPKPFRITFPFFPNFKFDLPFPKPNSSSKVAEVSGKEEDRRTAVVDGGDSESLKPNFVTFPKSQVIVPPPLETEAEQTSKTSNPIIIWQVYALGAIIISRWVWARWNERKAKGRSPNDESAQNKPSDEGDGRPSENE